MKPFLFIATLALTLAFTNSMGQCNVTRQDAGEDAIYWAANERMFETQYPDPAKIVSARMSCMKINIELPAEVDRMRYTWRLYIYSAGDHRYTSVVVPRQVVVDFSDGSRLVLSTEFLFETSRGETTTVEHGYIVLDADQLEKLRAQDISRLTVLDTRTNKQIVCRPYRGLLREQANCVAGQAGYDVIP